MIPIYMDKSPHQFLLSMVLLFYIVLEFIYPLSDFTELPKSFDKTRLAFFVRLWLLFLIVFVACVIPTLEGVYLRVSTPVEDDGFSPAYEKMHDGALQMEIAVDAFIKGENPYSIRYDHTPIRFFRIGGVDYELTENPYFHYFPYLPGYILLSAPLYQLSVQTGLFYDQRLIYLLFYLLLIFLLPLFAKAPVHKLLLIALVGLNLGLVGPVVIGMNDIVAIFFLVLTCYLAINKRFVWAALVLGLACTVKQSAWFVVPFYFLFIWQIIPWQERKVTWLKMIGAMSVCPILFLVPFFLWDPTAFVADIFSYPAGNVEYNYPIRGYTVGVLLIEMGVIKNSLDSFPFWIFQLLVGVPILFLLLRYQWRRNDIGTMLICASFFTFAFGFLSRFFQQNYLGYVVVIMSLGVLIAPATLDLFQGEAE